MSGGQTTAAGGSSGGGGVGGGIKYEKLVQEYVKLRSKLTILKKAYVELSETSAQKDQALRKCEQEIEGLSFRNQQLTSRVEVLQRDLAEATTSTSGGGTLLNGSDKLNSNNSLGSNNLVKLSPSTPSLASPSGGTAHPNSSSNLLVATSSNHSLGNHSSSHHSMGSFRQQQQQPDDKVLAEELEHKINENTVLHRFV